MKTLTRRILLTVAAFSFVSGGILTYIFREQIRNWIIKPVSYVIWYINLVLETVPQPILWAVLILGGFIIFTRALLKSIPPPDEPPLPNYSTQSFTRYQYWLWYISTFQTSVFTNEHLGRNLSRLVVDILAFQEHLTLDEVDERVRARTLALPEEIRQLVLTHRLPGQAPSSRRIQRWIDRILKRKPQTTELTANPEAQNTILNIISFIEERLELQHEPSR